MMHRTNARTKGNGGKPLSVPARAASQLYRKTSESQAPKEEAMETVQTALTPTEVRAPTACPKCGATRGNNCRRSCFHRDHGWVRIANHRERVNEAGRAYA